MTRLSLAPESIADGNCVETTVTVSICYVGIGCMRASQAEKVLRHGSHEWRMALEGIADGKCVETVVTVSIVMSA